MGEEISRPPRRHWRETRNIYALSLIDIRVGDVAVTGSVNTFLQSVGGSIDVVTAAGEDGPLEYIFNMNPQEMGLEEPAAVHIVPTQDGGQYIEHQGQIYKNISIRGTTGLRPNRTTRNFIPVLNVANPFAAADRDPETGLPSGEQTGFDDLLGLRNLFRKYWARKEDEDLAPFTIMVWQNGKEGEFYVVEPIMFRTTRAASSPFTFSYDIQLRTIERLDLSRLLRPIDSYTETTGRLQFLDRLREHNRTLSQAFVLARSVSDSAALLGQQVLTRVFDPVNTILQGLTGVLTSTRNAIAIPRNTIAGLAQTTFDLADEIYKFRPEVNSYKQLGLANRQTLAANSFKKIGFACARIAAEDSLFAESVGENHSRKVAAYRSAVNGLPRTGGDPTNLVNDPPATGTGQSTVQSGETVRGAAQRLLGNRNRWRQLVLLNNLKPPYFSDDGDGINVLRPNDPLLFPKSGSQEDTPISNDRTVNEVRTDAFTNRLGRDLRLVAFGQTGGVNNFDLAINAKGDIDLIEGVDNMIQAVKIKFSTEPGQLPAHPFFGVRSPIGEKATQRSIVAFQMNARATLLSDRRVEDLRRFSVTIDGNVMNVSATVKIKELDQLLSVAFGVQR